MKAMFVVLRDNGSETGRWVKLDDGDVSECAMHDDEEMKAQCFGGEYMGEVSHSAYRLEGQWILCKDSVIQKKKLDPYVYYDSVYFIYLFNFFYITFILLFVKNFFD